MAPAEPAQDDRPYDLVLLGATGFAGRLTARHLAGRLAGGGGLRWAVAGRDRRRLQTLADDLDGEVAVEVADVTDLPGLLELAGRTRVLASTVGPYARLGELVVQACVRRGTDYCDITGEPSFVDLVRHRYGRDAEQRGVRLVSCCGFDSVPPDLGTQLLVSRLPADRPVTVRGYVWANARFSGGTLTSGLEAASGSPLSTLAPPDEDHADGRRIGSAPLRIHRVRELSAWGVPLPTIDPQVVLRSARALPAYGPEFRYGHFAEVPNLGLVAAGVVGVGVVAGLARLGPTRRLLRALAPDPGEGPSRARRERSRFRLTLLGEAGGEHAAVRVSGGDPGYDETARMLGEAALTLAGHAGADGDVLEAAGALTPAVALGPAYRRRLQQQGIDFTVR